MSAEVDAMSEVTRRSLGNAGFYWSLPRLARRALRWACLGLALFGAVGCVTTPVTGRKAFNVIPVEQDKQLGGQAYAEVMSTSKLADNHPQFPMVQRCVDRLVAVSDDPGFEWEVHLIDEPQTVNAWCMPGGKMAVYTGILPVTKDETGLAVVMAHEIGHAIARHGTERMSLELGPSIAVEYFGGDTKALAGAVLQYGAFMPWGRKQELEADEIGIIYMARAGYDPRQAVDFWKRMSAQSQGGAPPEFLSTHPSDSTRIEQLEKLLPKAMKIYEGSSTKGAKP